VKFSEVFENVCQMADAKGVFAYSIWMEVFGIYIQGRKKKTFLRYAQANFVVAYRFCIRNPALVGS
jgi:hypothetical protein